MPKFTELSAYGRLKELSENPIDLTAKGELTPKRIDQMIAEGGGLKLFYSSERVDEPVLEALFQLAEEAKAVEKIGGGILSSKDL